MVVDTSALIAILLQEEDAQAYADAIAAAATATLSAASYVELAIVALSRGVRGRAELEATLAGAAIEIVPVTLDQARVAARAYERYAKGRHPATLNFGDCFAYALAKSRSEPRLFEGTDFGLTDVSRVHDSQLPRPLGLRRRDRVRLRWLAVAGNATLRAEVRIEGPVRGGSCGIRECARAVFEFPGGRGGAQRVGEGLRRRQRRERQLPRR